jgi:hypothetical protein
MSPVKERMWYTKECRFYGCIIHDAQWVFPPPDHDIEPGTVSYINEMHAQIQRFLQRISNIDVNESMNPPEENPVDYIRKTAKIGRDICGRLSLVRAEPNLISRDKTEHRDYRLIPKLS